MKAIGLTLVAISTLVVTCHAASPSVEQRYVNHLRELGMYRLAEVYCREQSAADGLTDRERVEMAIELSLVAVSRAHNAPPGDRDHFWQQAFAPLEGWLATADRPFRLLAELQDALNRLNEAEIGRLEQVGYANQAATELVQSRVRSAIANLRSIADTIKLRRRELALGQVSGPADLDERELAGLGRNVSLALARAYREQAFTYTPGSPDRVNALQQAAELLTPLAAALPAVETTWEARVALAKALTELGQVDEGRAAITQWQSEVVPPDIAVELVAADAKLLATAGQIEDGLAMLDASGIAPGSAPSVDLVRLELLVASNSRDSGAIESLLASIRAKHAARYVRQAEALVGQAYGGSDDATTAGGKVLAAEHFYRAGQLPAAIAAYDEAAEMYRDARDRERAFAAERSAAAIVQQRGDYLQAAERFRRLALGSVDRDNSATDHREAILSLATAVKQSGAENSDRAMVNYLELCREHLRHWPAGYTSAEVRWWLAQALAARRQWQATIDVLGELDSASPYFKPSTTLLSTAFRHRVATETDPTKRQALIVEAVSRLQPLVVGSGDQIGWPSAWTDAQRACALELARLQIDGGNSGYAKDMLDAAVVRGQPPPSAEYRAQATPVLAIALVSTGNTAEAIELLRESARAGGNAGSLESLAERLTAQLFEYSQSDVPRRTERAAIGQLLLATLSPEVAGDGTSSWALPADRYRAAAMAAVANDAVARQLYESLVAKYPKNGDLQEEYARLLASANAASDRESALAAFHRIERSTRRGSDRWRRARQARIDLLIQLGRNDEAEKLKALTRLLGNNLDQN